MRKTVKFLSVFSIVVLMLTMLPFSAFAEEQVVDISHNFLFRTVPNAGKITAGNTSRLEFVPQYTARYTINLHAHHNGGGRRFYANLYDGETNNWLAGISRENDDRADITRVDITYFLDKGHHYYYLIEGALATTECTVDVSLSSEESALMDQNGLTAKLTDTYFDTFSEQELYNRLSIQYNTLSGLPYEWRYIDFKSLNFNGVDVIVDTSGCGTPGKNVAKVYYLGYKAECAFTVGTDDTTSAPVTEPTTEPTTQPQPVTPPVTEPSASLPPATEPPATQPQPMAPPAAPAPVHPSTTAKQAVKSVTLSASTYTYNGKAKAPKITVKNSKNQTLKKGTDYTVKYINQSTKKTVSSMKSVGKYTVQITMKGNYKGTYKKTVTIIPKSTGLSKLTAGKKKFTAKWKKQTSQTTGYQIQYSTSSKFKSAKTVTISKNKTTSKSVSKLKAKKKYYVRVRTYKTVKINGKNTKIYSSWSKVKTVTTKK